MVRPRGGACSLTHQHAQTPQVHAIQNKPKKDVRNTHISIQEKDLRKDDRGEVIWGVRQGRSRGEAGARQGKERAETGKRKRGRVTIDYPPPVPLPFLHSPARVLAF